MKFNFVLKCFSQSLRSVGKFLDVGAKQTGEDTRGRAFITVALTHSMAVVGIIAFVASSLRQLREINNLNGSSPSLAFIFAMIFILLSYLSRRGKHAIAGYALVLLIVFGASYVVCRWSIDAPMGLLLYALAIFMTGILISTRFAILLTILTSIFLGSLGVLQTQGILSPDNGWIHQRVESGDVITFTAIFLVIGFVSMLSNNEINRSLRLALASEAALRKEKNTLELKVRRRTKLLEQEHKVRIHEMRRFVEFGRLSAGLIHDIANPLTAASINLEALKSKQKSILIKSAISSIKYLEDYVESARAQLQDKSELMLFSVSDEIAKIILLLKHKASNVSVDLLVSQSESIDLYGDRLKFNQILLNLIANAIDSYEHIEDNEVGRRVMISVERRAVCVRVVVRDYGSGISAVEIKKVFQPFFSTKRTIKGGSGIGLMTVKQLVENDFRGKVYVKSSVRKGTYFIVDLKNAYSLLK